MDDSNNDDPDGGGGSSVKHWKTILIDSFTQFSTEDNNNNNNNNNDDNNNNDNDDGLLILADVACQALQQQQQENEQQQEEQQKTTSTTTCNNKKKKKKKNNNNKKRKHKTSTTTNKGKKQLTTQQQHHRDYHHVRSDYLRKMEQKLSKNNALCDIRILDEFDRGFLFDFKQQHQQLLQLQQLQQQQYNSTLATTSSLAAIDRKKSRLIRYVMENVQTWCQLLTNHVWFYNCSIRNGCGPGSGPSGGVVNAWSLYPWGCNSLVALLPARVPLPESVVMTLQPTIMATFKRKFIKYCKKLHYHHHRFEHQFELIEKRHQRHQRYQQYQQQLEQKPKKIGEDDVAFSTREKFCYLHFVPQTIEIFPDLKPTTTDEFVELVRKLFGYDLELNEYIDDHDHDNDGTDHDLKFNNFTHIIELAYYYFNAKRDEELRYTRNIFTNRRLLLEFCIELAQEINDPNVWLDELVCFCGKPMVDAYIQCALCHDWMHRKCASQSKTVNDMMLTNDDATVTMAPLYICCTCLRFNWPTFEEIDTLYRLMVGTIVHKVIFIEGELFKKFYQSIEKWKIKANALINLVNNNCLAATPTPTNVIIGVSPSSTITTTTTTASDANHQWQKLDKEKFRQFILSNCDHDHNDDDDDIDSGGGGGGGKAFQNELCKQLDRGLKLGVDQKELRILWIYYVHMRSIIDREKFTTIIPKPKIGNHQTTTTTTELETKMNSDVMDEKNVHNCEHLLHYNVNYDVMHQFDYETDNYDQYHYQFTVCSFGEDLCLRPSANGIEWYNCCYGEHSTTTACTQYVHKLCLYYYCKRFNHESRSLRKMIMKRMMIMMMMNRNGNNDNDNDTNDFDHDSMMILFPHYNSKPPKWLCMDHCEKYDEYDGGGHDEQDGHYYHYRSNSTMMIKSDEDEDVGIDIDIDDNDGKSETTIVKMTEFLKFFNDNANKNVI